MTLEGIEKEEKKVVLILLVLLFFFFWTNTSASLNCRFFSDFQKKKKKIKQSSHLQNSTLLLTLIFWLYRVCDSSCRLGRMLQRKSEAEEYVFNTLFCPLISFGVASVSSQTCSDNGHFRRPNGTYDVNRRVILSFSSFQRHGSRGFLLQRFHRPGTQPYLRSRDVHPRINFRGLFRLYQNRFWWFDA